MSRRGSTKLSLGSDRIPPTQSKSSIENRASRSSLLRLSFIASAAIVPTAAISLSGCGGSPTLGGGTQSASTAVSIVSQPASQTTPLGQTATFTVTATGTAPISYQWSKNDVAIAGATSASYTIQAVTTSDNAAAFTVKVSNSVNSVASNKAKLIIGPRSPKAGDLRFQQVDAPSMANQQSGKGLMTAVLVQEQSALTNATGSPLQIGGDCGPADSPLGCEWFYIAQPLPNGQSGLNTTYQGDYYTNFSSDLASIEAPNTVITSLDLEPVSNAYAAAWMASNQTDRFDARLEAVSPSDLPTVVAQDAQQSRVVTAISFDASGQANLLSYGWQGDTTTVYDTAVVSVDASDILGAVKNLAAQGYIITAFGGNTTNGFLLVGTKVHGDTLSRPIAIADQSSPPSSKLAGYAPVAWYFLPNGNSDLGTQIYEK